VLGGSGDWFRVRTPDGREGWLPARLTESADRALGELMAGAGSRVLARPGENAPVVLEVAPATALAVHGAFAGFTYVETPRGLRGWVSRQD
jgi:SH3-like domain-containing protein